MAYAPPTNDMTAAAGRDTAVLPAENGAGQQGRSPNGRNTGGRNTPSGTGQSGRSANGSPSARKSGPGKKPSATGNGAQSTGGKASEVLFDTSNADGIKSPNAESSDLETVEPKTPGSKAEDPKGADVVAKGGDDTAGDATAGAATAGDATVEDTPVRDNDARGGSSSNGSARSAAHKRNAAKRRAANRIAPPRDEKPKKIDPARRAAFFAQHTIMGIERFIGLIRDQVIPDILRHDPDLLPDSPECLEYASVMGSFDGYRTLVFMWSESAFLDESVRDHLGLTQVYDDDVLSASRVAACVNGMWTLRVENAGDSSVAPGPDQITPVIQRTMITPLTRAGYLERIVADRSPDKKNGAEKGNGRAKAEVFVRATEKFHDLMVAAHTGVN